MQEVTTGMREKEIDSTEWIDRRMEKENKTLERSENIDTLYITFIFPRRFFICI